MLRYSREIAPDIAVVSTPVSNAYLVGQPQSWILVDSCAPGSEKRILNAAAERFGLDARPEAIVLTHGHFDHAGSAPELAAHWGVRVHAHRLEFPYLTGRSSYPPLDPTTPGFFSALSRFFPSRTVNLVDVLAPIDPDNPLGGLPGWECLLTPGHTPGHVAFYRASDGVLLAGDAVTTMDLDRMWPTLTKQPKVCRPPTPGTTDWEQAQRSVRILAALNPALIAAGHGNPMRDAAGQLQGLAAHFPIPEHGRYVREPARADESGVTYLPAAPFDPVPVVAVGLAVGTGVAFAAARLSRKGKTRD